MAEEARVGPYVLGPEIGRGGMGRVFVAQRPGQPGDVAIKVMLAEMAQDSDSTRRFLREAGAMAAVRHPRLVEILEAGNDDGRPYIVMPHLEGSSLDRVIAGRGALPAGEIRRIVADVAGGLDALHAAGITHRDVKPSNIMVGDDGRATLMDLGLVKSSDYSMLTRGGRVIGTLDYLAPELIRGETASPCSDVYALGCVTFEALTGRHPFEGGMFEVGLGHLEQDPPRACELRPDLDPSIDDALGYALAKDPARRPRTATAFSTLVGAAVGS